MYLKGIHTIYMKTCSEVNKVHVFFSTDIQYMYTHIYTAFRYVIEIWTVQQLHTEKSSLTVVDLNLRELLPWKPGRSEECGTVGASLQPEIDFISWLSILYPVIDSSSHALLPC